MTNEARGHRAHRVTLVHLALLVPWVGLVIGALRPVTDNSFLWHIRAGSLQAALGSVLTNDPFSFTMQGKAWRTQSWLADLIYGRLEAVFGIGFVGLMLITLGVVTLIAVGVLAFRLSDNLQATAAVVLITAFLLSPVLVPRPVIFTFPLLVLVILAWERRELRWVLPFLFWLWASLHGSFFIGGVYILLRAISTKEFRNSLAPVVASVLATMLTAHGLGVVTIVTDFLTARPYLSLMQEWRTPDLISTALMPFLLAVIWLLFLAVGGRLTRSSLWIVVPFLILALSASRAVFTAWLALTPVYAAASRGAVRDWGRGFPLPIALVVVAVVGLGPFLFARPVALDEERFPIAAAAHLNDVPTFHDDLVGGYLIYEEGFSDGVFIDDRVELFRHRMTEMVAVRSGREDWKALFERDGIRQALIAVDGPLLRLLQNGGWQVHYQDERYALLRP